MASTSGVSGGDSASDIVKQLKEELINKVNFIKNGGEINDEIIENILGKIFSLELERRTPAMFISPLSRDTRAKSPEHTHGDFTSLEFTESKSDLISKLKSRLENQIQSIIDGPVFKYEMVDQVHETLESLKAMSSSHDASENVDDIEASVAGNNLSSSGGDSPKEKKAQSAIFRSGDSGSSSDKANSESKSSDDASLDLDTVSNSSLTELQYSIFNKLDLDAAASNKERSKERSSRSKDDPLFTSLTPSSEAYKSTGGLGSVVSFNEDKESTLKAGAKGKKGSSAFFRSGDSDSSHEATQSKMDDVDGSSQKQYSIFNKWDLDAVASNKEKEKSAFNKKVAISPAKNKPFQSSMASSSGGDSPKEKKAQSAFFRYGDSDSSSDKATSESKSSDDAFLDLDTVSNSSLTELQYSIFNKLDLDAAASNKERSKERSSRSKDDPLFTSLTPSSEAYKSTGGLGSVVSFNEDKESTLKAGAKGKKGSSAFFRSGDSDSRDEATPSKRDDVDGSSELGHFRKFFRKISYLGEGGFGVVFKCQHLLDCKLYAIKKIGYTESDREMVLGEIVVHSMMDHRHVVRYHHSWAEEGFDVTEFEDNSVFEPNNLPTHTLYLQMELCDGSIKDLMEKQRVRTKAQNYDYMIQIFHGLEHIHSRGYIHSDITNQNIFFDSIGSLKIGDFGKAKVYEDVPLLVSGEDLGVEIYQAPEVFESDIQIDPKFDIYSAGLVFYELMYPMRTNMEREGILRNIRRGIFVNVLPGSFLERDPAERPTASEAVLFFADLIAHEKAHEDEEIDIEETNKDSIEPDPGSVQFP